MPVKKILTSEDLNSIADFLTENGYNEAGLKVLIKVDDKQTLQNISDDYYYRFAANDENAVRKEDVNEVNVNIGDIEFSYIIREDYSGDVPAGRKQYPLFHAHCLLPTGCL